MTAKVFVTRPIPDAGLEVLRQAIGKFDINPDDRVLTKQELIERVEGCDGVLCLLTDNVDAEVIDAATGCRIFANCAVGYNNIDVEAATARGIAVSNTPGVLTDATADLTWALLMAAARRIVPADAYTRAGKYKAWGPMLFLGADITGRTLGIIGAGRIGSAVARRSTGFEMKILYTDTHPNETIENDPGAKKVPLDTLLQEADFVCVHVPLADDTHHLLGRREFGMMKKSAVLVNTSRGPVLDEAALVAALRSGEIFAAGLDVFEDEPSLKPGLAQLDNVVIPPHIGSATIATRNKMAEMAATNITALLNGHAPPNCINPEVLDQK
ncbi:MAG: D-glycerate dehydrogenase [Planctomycetes bacterium]|nr:D-glycerate dehydrogenase [Planctomycetota bacterium]